MYLCEASYQDGGQSANILCLVTHAKASHLKMNKTNFEAVYDAECRKKCLLNEHLHLTVTGSMI